MATTLGTTTTTTTFEKVSTSRNDKMMLQSATSHPGQDDFYDSLEKEQEERDSLETESITLTNNNDSSSSSSSSDEDGEEEEGEIIHLHRSEEEEEEELDDYQTMLREAERGYKRMELKGESESDKDLIIYSLNESLQIHKEIVERIQNEKDDLEDQYESEKALKKQAEQEQILQIEREKAQGQERVNKLEQMHVNLQKELENKKLEYKRMETRFYSHVKGVKQDEKHDSLSVMTIKINQLINRVSELCSFLSTNNTTEEEDVDWWSSEEMDRYNHVLQNLDTQQRLAILIEKKLMEILTKDIFNCSIHPGVSLNEPFQQIHQWVEKRNTSWASRMKQQITSFIVQQSNEETDKIQSAQQDIVAKIFFYLNQLYALQEQEEAKEEIIKLVEMAMQLNLSMKCCQEEYKISILPIIEMRDSFDENYMVNLSSDNGLILLVISPPFVAKEKSNVIVSAKVYC